MREAGLPRSSPSRVFVFTWEGDSCGGWRGQRRARLRDTGPKKFSGRDFLTPEKRNISKKASPAAVWVKGDSPGGPGGASCHPSRARGLATGSAPQRAARVGLSFPRSPARPRAGASPAGAARPGLGAAADRGRQSARAPREAARPRPSPWARAAWTRGWARAPGAELRDPLRGDAEAPSRPEARNSRAGALGSPRLGLSSAATRRRALVAWRPRRPGKPTQDTGRRSPVDPGRARAWLRAAHALCGGALGTPGLARSGSRSLSGRAARPAEPPRPRRPRFPPSTPGRIQSEKAPLSFCVCWGRCGRRRDRVTTFIS